MKNIFSYLVSEVPEELTEEEEAYVMVSSRPHRISCQCGCRMEMPHGDPTAPYRFNLPGKKTEGANAYRIN